MRVDLHKVASAGRGDTVVVTAKLPRDQHFARLEVWSATPGFELSPHVFTHQLLVNDSEGRPQMVTPMGITLHEKRREYHFEFVTDEDLDFVIRQDIDVADDPRAKAKVKCYGKTFSAIRRRVRNAYRAARNRAAGYFGKAQRQR
jgi:hypothetical protein